MIELLKDCESVMLKDKDGKIKYIDPNNFYDILYDILNEQILQPLANILSTIDLEIATLMSKDFNPKGRILEQLKSRLARHNRIKELIFLSNLVTMELDKVKCKGTLTISKHNQVQNLNSIPKEKKST
jgi:hypothetical protein